MQIYFLDRQHRSIAVNTCSTFSNIMYGAWQRLIGLLLFNLPEYDTFEFTLYPLA